MITSSGDELTSLLHVLQHLTKLQSLQLEDNTIEDFQQVAIAIANSKSLKEVYLSNNNLQLAGAQQVAEILMHSEILIDELMVSDMTIGHEGAILLAEALSISSVRVLSIPREYFDWIKANHYHRYQWHRLTYVLNA